MIEVDPRSEVPIYQQIRDRIVEAIASGELRPEDTLVSVRQLATMFGINSATVAKAYDALRQDGLIRTNHKSGSVVSRGPGQGTSQGFIEQWQGRARTLLSEAIAQGLTDAEVMDQVAGIVADIVRAQYSNARAHAEDTP
ncbi:GntR family transcriptional regulator [Leucobacter sp. M11]|uniref:GntR family transcriptional regulator n=1 Tax=Leucobacter sp. M11 TaxID=2993565 RepID=UPI002D7E2EA5|nr:GntR family transcriptional regulator [Leucobacter sp. M11]MEB4613777.1 GntR family transcriptional regulator [Leucobacter sp. M11]